MLVSEISLFSIAIPLQVEFAHHLFSRRTSDSLIVLSRDTDGHVGYGEGVPRPYVTGETWAQAVSAAKKMALACKGNQFGNWEELSSFLEKMAEHQLAKDAPSAWCAIELSILDLWSKRNKIPLWRLFIDKPQAKEFHYSASIPLFPLKRLEQILKIVKEGLQIDRVKLKVKGINQGREALFLAREILGAKSEIRVDANGAFDLESALRFLELSKDASLTAIEQPVDKYDLTSFKEITERARIITIADESMFATQTPISLLDDGICRGLNIRVSSCGGFMKSLSLAWDVIARGGILQLGGHVGETSVLSAAARHLAAVVGHVRFMEGAASKYLYSFDISRQDISFGKKGYAPLLDGSGLGIEINEELLSQRATAINY